ncbi:MAG TPA: protein phosphatase 2C domain-containing protein [Actinocrinis sp.]|nr:protein phosphatase 2C domain-containing protein [Actinocrinis sp.]
MISIRAGAATDSGRVRDHNEDSVFAGTGLYAVADGIGGHAAGEVASAMAVARLERLGGLDDLNPESVRSCLALANREILDSALRHPEQAGMGTTVAGMALARFAGTDHWVVFNVGDCRVYRLAGDLFDQLTIDHTEVAELIAAGTLDPDQAHRHPRRNVVTRALGTDPAPEVDVWILPPKSGERFLICSDGLPLELADSQIAHVLREQPDAGAAARLLVSLAVEAGGRDNVSAVVVDALQIEESDPGPGIAAGPGAAVGPEAESGSVDDTAPRVQAKPPAGAAR